METEDAPDVEENVPATAVQALLDKLNHPPTIERLAFVDGLFKELNIQLERYQNLVKQMGQLKASIMIMERNVRLTREHLRMVLSQPGEDVPKIGKKFCGK